MSRLQHCFSWISWFARHFLWHEGVEELRAGVHMNALWLTAHLQDRVQRRGVELGVREGRACTARCTVSAGLISTFMHVAYLPETLFFTHSSWRGLESWFSRGFSLVFKLIWLDVVGGKRPRLHLPQGVAVDRFACIHDSWGDWQPEDVDKPSVAH
jgi:hypothetical protein